MVAMARLIDMNLNEVLNVVGWRDTLPATRINPSDNA